MDPLEIIESTAEPAFGTDESGRLVIWNSAMEKLLGHHPGDILGKPCHDILCGRDSFGNRFCDSHCGVASMIARHESINRFPLTLRRADRSDVSVWLTIISVPGQKPTQHTVIHILTPVESQETIESAAPRRAPTWASSQPVTETTAASQADQRLPIPALTSREREVLEMMADGTSTPDIADALFISVSTVRSHTQSILGKLDAHSKLEAVAIALRQRMI